MPVVVGPVLLGIETYCPERPGIFRTIEEQQFHSLGVLRKDAEIDASVRHGRSERKTVPTRSVNHGSI